MRDRLLPFIHLALAIHVRQDTTILYIVVEKHRSSDKDNSQSRYRQNHRSYRTIAYGT